MFVLFFKCFYTCWDIWNVYNQFTFVKSCFIFLELKSTKCVQVVPVAQRRQLMKVTRV